MRGPFHAQIEQLAAIVQHSPTKMSYFKRVPREVVFFGRVMTCLRKNCELLGDNISAIDCWVSKIGVSKTDSPKFRLRSLRS